MGIVLLCVGIIAFGVFVGFFLLCWSIYLLYAAVSSPENPENGGFGDGTPK